MTDVATAVHFYEAILATFSILLWHFYIAISDPLVYPMDTSWLDGRVPAGHYRLSRPAYLYQLEEQQRQTAETEVHEKEEEEKEE